MRYVLGVDGGGSKVVCLAADDCGNLLGYGRGGSVNTNYVLRREAMTSLHTAVDSALRTADLPSEKIDALCMSAPMSPDAVEETISKFKIKKVVRAAEGETPRWAARFWIEGHIGLAVDAGTGAMARGWAKDGREAGAGGWGATLGDEGSSFWIGLEAMRAILKAYDGRIKPTMLTEPVLNHLGLSDMLDLVFKADPRIVREALDEKQVRVAPDSGAENSRSGDPWAGGIYFREEPVEPRVLTRSDVAGLCPIIAEVARTGDWKAKEIFLNAGRELAQAGVAVIRRLGMEDEDFVILPFGGVFRAGEMVLGPFRNVIEEAAPLARVVEPPFEPVVGAVLLALDTLGLEFSDSIVTALEQSSESFPECRGRH